MIVASMIAYNERGRYLPLAIAHLLTFCDEVRLLDDHSTDGTFEWAQEVDGVSVKRNPVAPMFEHESRARNELLAWTMEAAPEYVLSIDADEFVSDTRAVLAAATLGGDVYSLTMAEVWEAEYERLGIRFDGFWKRRVCPVLWRAPKRWMRIWDIPNRQLACGREPAAVRRMRAVPTSSDILHFGWANIGDRDRRYARYVEHDGGRFHASRHLQSIMWTDSRVKIKRERWPQDLIDLRPELLLATDFGVRA